MKWTHPDATMLLQTTLLLNVHAENRGRNEIANGDKAEDSIDNSQVIDLGALTSRAEGEAGAPEREAAAAGSERLFSMKVDKGKKRIAKL